MTKQKWYRVDFYVAMLDAEEFIQTKTLKEAVDEISDLIGDCTIIPCIGSYFHKAGVRVNMNALKVVKFCDKNPDEFIGDFCEKLKRFFNQESIIAEVSECVCLKFI